MDKTGKKAALAELETVFEESGAVVVTHYSGLSVAEMTGLRTQLREKGATLKVIKNRIAKIALKGKGGDAALDLFQGPVAIAYAEDPSSAAKVTSEFAKTNEKLKLIGAIMDEEVMDEAIVWEEDLDNVEEDIQGEPKVELLERQLEKAIDKEEYEMAARIRDKINKIEN